MDDIPVPPDLCPKLSTAPKRGYELLAPFLRKQTRDIDRVLGDGNCLFWALSSQLTGSQEHHLELRKAIARFEQKNEAVFKPLHASINCTPFENRLQNIKKSCAWGTLVEILAFSSLFQIEVFVATDSYYPGWPSCVPRTPPSNPLAVVLSGFSMASHVTLQKDWIEIAHVSQSHFDAIKPQIGMNLQRPVLKRPLHTDSS